MLRNEAKKRGSMGYLTKEGFKNVWSNRLMSIASVSVLLSCLVIIGVAFMAVMNMGEVINNIENQNVIMAFVRDEASEAETKQVGEDIKNLSNIKECIFVSKEESFNQQIKTIDTDSKIFNDVENPLPDAYKVVVSDLSRFDSTVDSVKNVKNVLSVRENRQLALQLANVRKTVSYISLGVIAVLLLVSLFIIANTVKLTMFSRRLEIRIMKSVGATSWFIRWPFMVEGMVLGIISGILSLGIVWGIYSLVKKALEPMLKFLFRDGFVPFSQYALYLMGAFAIIGILAGAVGSAISINRYIKEQEYDSHD